MSPWVLLKSQLFRVTPQVLSFHPPLCEAARHLWHLVRAPGYGCGLSPAAQMRRARVEGPCGEMTLKQLPGDTACGSVPLLRCWWKNTSDPLLPLLKMWPRS